MSVTWDRRDPTLFETTVATLICAATGFYARQFRPSRGDRGIDVYVPLQGSSNRIDVYQVKYFPGRLDASRKRQIADSLATVIKNYETRINEWHLVIPTNLTPEEDDWFNDVLTAGMNDRFHWKGLPYLDGLASTYPSIIDYHLYADRRGLEKKLEQIGSLTEAATRLSKDRLDIQNIREVLPSLLQAVNDDDPHFYWDLAASPNEPDHTPDSTNHGLVSAHTVFDGTTYVTTRMFARFEEALRLRPLPPFMVTIAPGDNKAFASEFQSFVDYGTSVTIPGVHIADYAAPSLLGFDPGIVPAEIRITPRRIERDEPNRYWYLQAVPPDGEPVEILVELVRRGQGRSGVSVEARMLDGQMTVHAVFSEPGTVGSIKLHAPEPEGRYITALLREARFSAGLVSGGTISFQTLDRQTAFRASLGRRGESTWTTSTLDSMWIELLEDLTVLSRYSVEPLRLPAHLTTDDIVDARSAARMLRGERLVERWSTLSVGFIPESFEEIRDSLVQNSGNALVHEHAITFELGDTSIPLGVERRIFLNAYFDLDSLERTDEAIQVPVRSGGDNVFTRELTQVPEPFRSPM